MSTDVTAQPGDRRTLSRSSTWFQWLFSGTSIALCLAASLIFSFQPDACAAVLILPRWLWIFPGLLLAILGWIQKRNRFTTAAFAVWLLYALFFVQEFRNLIRFHHSPEVSRSSDLKIRVISLNCAAGSEIAAAEVADYDPDIVLFQESPSSEDIHYLASKVFGQDAGVYRGFDVSLIARGNVSQVNHGESWNAPFIHARVELPSKLVVEVLSIRLNPYGIRADLWTPACWKEQRENRITQRQEFEWVAREVQKIPPGVPIIIGGDFNLPAGDKLFRILPSRIRDTFRSAGRGWGDSLVNDFPFIRIDQIWCDDHFRPVSTRAHKTVNSDHRMVICDLEYQAPHSNAQ